jgi:Spy/CpxP family protein refolding chaperone
MNRWTPRFTRRAIFGTLGALALIGSALTLQGFRGPWHHGFDPARFDEHMNEVQQDIAEHLRLTPQQQPQFDALMGQFRALAKERRDRWHQTAAEVKQALDQEPANATAVADALRKQVQDRADPARLDQLIDATLSFYNTLQPEQQQTVQKHLQRRLRHVLE